MTTAVPNTLLALLLALKNLDKPLSENERQALAEIGQDLESNSNDWSFIEDNLMTIIQANDTLNQLYQEAKSKLDTLNSPIPPNLLPTDAELENAPSPESKGGTRAHPPYGEDQPDEQSNEILNLVTNVVSTEKPEETAKKLSFLERISQFLNQPNSKND